MSKTDCDNDADSSVANSSDDGGVDGNGVFDTKGDDEADDSSKQTESVDSDLAVMEVMEVPKWKWKCE